MKEHVIDNLFKEKLDHYKVAPSRNVWKKVKAGFFGDTVIYNYRKILWAVAVLLFLLVVGYLLLKQNDGFTIHQNPVIKQDKDTAIILKEKQNTESPEIDISKQTIGINNLTKNVEVPSSNEQKQNMQTFETKQKVRPHFLAKESIFAKTETTEYSKRNEQKMIKENSQQLISYLALRSLRLNTLSKIELLPQFAFDQIVEPYLKKHNNLHLWTATATAVEKVYYPNAKDMASWSAGLSFGVNTGNFYITSGILYEKTNEQAAFKINFKSYDSIGYYNRVVSFEVNPENPEKVTFKTKKTTVYDSLVHFNMTHPVFHFTYINIPVTVGYKFFKKGKLIIAMETGLIFSELIEQNIPEIRFDNPNYHLLGIIRETPDRSNFNYRWLIALRFNYKIKRRISICLQPTFTKYLNNIYVSGIVVKPYTMGLQCGIYYDF